MTRPGFYIPDIFKAFPELVAGESRRRGGFGKPPYESLNLSWFTKDDLTVVEANRQAFFSALGFEEKQVGWTHQVHGSDILSIDAPGEYKGFDALITAKKGILLAISIADCTPVLVYDTDRHVVGAAHAGWRGTVGKIAYRTLQLMQHEFGSNPSNCHAFIGSCIGQNSFEVDADVADHFSGDFKVWDEQKQKFFVDIKGANFAQLIAAGIPAPQIEVSRFCTYEDNDLYFSHRKEKGVTGRMLAVIGMR